MNLGALVVLPLVVAGALLLSGISKIGQADATLATMRALRVPVVADSRLVARLVPWVEILVGLGVLLLPDTGYVASAWGAVVLLATLTGLVVASVARGEEVDCNCFGRLGRDERLGPGAIVRNCVLLAAALATALGAAGTRGVIGTVASFEVADLAWLGAIVLLGTGAAAIIFTRRPIADTPSITGIPIPDVDLVDGAGRSVPVPSLVNERATLLLFLRTDCGPCSTIARSVPGWTKQLGTQVDLVFPTSETPDAFARAYPEAAGATLFGARALHKSLGLTAFPAAVLLGRDRTVATNPVLGSDQVFLLVRDLVGLAGSREASDPAG